MLLTFLCLCILGLILFPGQSMEGACRGIALCGKTLIPALLPYFLLTRLIAPLLPEGKPNRKFLGISGSCIPAYILSFMGGYPTGVSSAVSLYESGKASKQEVQKVLGLCNNSGPAFFVSVIGLGLFGDGKKGLILYLIHVTSALLVALLYMGEGKALCSIRKISTQKQSFSQRFYDALSQSCSTMIQVCGLVILFSVFLSFLKMILPQSLMPLTGLVELSNGIGLLTASRESFVLCSVFMAWGGLCVHMQAMSLWKGAKLQPLHYWRNKLLHTLISGCLSYAYAFRHSYTFVILPIILLCFPVFYEIWGRKKMHLEV